MRISQLIRCYHIIIGWGLKHNRIEAFEWFKKSAELGNTSAAAYYAKCLKYGDGVEKDQELSDLWAKKVFSSNDNFAIAYCHHLQVGELCEFFESVAYFEESAKEGNEFAQSFLGYLYYYGIIVDRDVEKSFYLYLKAAEQGVCFAQHMIGNMYSSGHGCKKDEEKAIMWHKKSAKQGNDMSKTALKILTGK